MSRFQGTDVPLILLLWLTGLGAAAQYAKLSIVFDLLPAHYDAGPAALGFVVSIVGVVGIVFGAFAGQFVSRAGYRRSVIWALWAGAALSAAQALLPPLSAMLFLRALEGVSHLALVVAIPTLIAQVSTEQMRGLALTLWSTFFSVAFTLLIVLGLPLVALGGIPALFLAHTVWMVACALVLTPRLRKLELPSTASPPAAAQSFVRKVAGLYTSPFVIAPGIGWLFYTFCYLALLTLLPQILPEDQRAFVIGAMPLISITVSMTLGVWLMRRLGAMNVVAIGFGTTALCLLALMMSPGSAVICLVLAGTFGLIQGASFAAVPELNSSLPDRAKSNGVLAQMGNLGNTLGTPVLAAILAQTGQTAMMATAGAVFVFGLGVHWVLARLRKQHLAAHPPNPS